MSALKNLLRFSVLVRAVLTATPDLTVYGPTIAESLIENLAVTFQFSHALEVEYQVVPSNETAALMLKGEPVIVEHLTSDIPETSFVFPLFGFPLVFAYNLGEVATNSAPINLTQQLLKDIFLGQVTRWNDPNLTAINPSLTLPDQPIVRVVGELTDFLAEGLSVMFKETITESAILSANSTIYVEDAVCSKVLATPFTIGLTWMADAIEHNAKLAYLENEEGYFVFAGDGMPYALSEYQAAMNTAPDRSKVLPHNMPGRLSWPILGIIYLILPNSFSSCYTLNVTQHFTELVLFQEQSDRLVHVLGWEPAEAALGLLDHSLGAITDKFEYPKLLHSIKCEGTNELVILTHTLGTNSDLWSFALKMLVAYSDLNPFLVLASSSSNVTILLNDMLLGEAAGVDVDLTLTWQPVIEAHHLTAIPVFMGSLAPVVNLPFNIALSTSVLAGIFLGQIRRWDDSTIRTINPDADLPNMPIIVFAAPKGRIDGPTALLAQYLQNAMPSFSWNKVNITAPNEDNLLELVEFTPWSIGYDFGHNLGSGSSSIQVVSMIAPNASNPIVHTSDAVNACWLGKNRPDCWPLAIPLALAMRPPTTITCDHQKLSVDFINWVFTKEVLLDPFLVPNTGVESMGAAEFCNGRSLLKTTPEPQTLSASARAVIYVMCGIGMSMAVAQACSLAVARNQSDLKSASVLFSLLAVIGVFLMLVAPLLVVRDDVVNSHCAWALWFLCVGFSLAYGSLFAKLFRLYKIFTSRSLVVPRLSNRKLFYIVTAFLVLDFLLMLIYNLVTPPNPKTYSLFIPDEDDLVTHHRELTWNMCTYHEDGPVFIIIVVYKFLLALLGAAMAFAIRQVDRRFTATSALGWAFYNMFLTVVIAIILVVGFKSSTDLAPTLFIIVFCGLWIVLVTLAALTLDSNVLLACQEFSKPLRRMLASKDSKDSKERSKSITIKKVSNDEEPSGNKRSHSSTVFVINREMFPTKYEEFEQDLLERILEELNFQRTAVRRALQGNGTTPATTTGQIELAEVERTRGSTKVESPIKKYRSQSNFCNTPHSTEDNAKNSFEAKNSGIDSATNSRPNSQLSEPPTPTASTPPIDNAANQPSTAATQQQRPQQTASTTSTAESTNGTYKISIDAPDA